MPTVNFKNEFVLEGFSLKHDNPALFFTSQWQSTNQVNIFYLLYKIAIAIILLVTLIVSIFKFKGTRAKWLIYLTHWGYILCTVQVIFSVIVISREAILQKNIDYYEQYSGLYGFYWLIFTMSIDLAFIITIVYWSLIYTQDPVDAINIFLHGLNSVIMMLDLLLVANPIRIFHCIWTILFGIVYIIFTVIYFKLGGRSKDDEEYIYVILDWSKPLKTVLIVFGIIGFLIVIHLFVFLVYVARAYIHRACCE